MAYTQYKCIRQTSYCTDFETKDCSNSGKHYFTLNVNSKSTSTQIFNSLVMEIHNKFCYAFRKTVENLLLSGCGHHRNCKIITYCKL